jgi:hypothetical protein
MIEILKMKSAGWSMVSAEVVIDERYSPLEKGCCTCSSMFSSCSNLKLKTADRGAYGTDEM